MARHSVSLCVALVHVCVCCVLRSAWLLLLLFVRLCRCLRCTRMRPAHKLKKVYGQSKITDNERTNDDTGTNQKKCKTSRKQTSRQRKNRVTLYAKECGTFLVCQGVRRSRSAMGMRGGAALFDGDFMLCHAVLSLSFPYSASNTCIAFSILSMLFVSVSLLCAMDGSSFIASTSSLSCMSMNSFWH